jgi:hypothetical protein
MWKRTAAERELRSKISLNVTWAAICLVGGIAFLAIGRWWWAAFGIGLTAFALVFIYRDVQKLAALEGDDGTS